jgi:hypothetical protein
VWGVGNRWTLARKIREKRPVPRRLPRIEKLAPYLLAGAFEAGLAFMFEAGVPVVFFVCFFVCFLTFVLAGAGVEGVAGAGLV